MKAMKAIMDTPVDVLTEEFYPYLSDREVIMRVAGKWSKRARKVHTKWPKEGSFDKGVGAIGRYK